MCFPSSPDSSCCSSSSVFTVQSVIITAPSFLRHMSSSEIVVSQSYLSRIHFRNFLSHRLVAVRILVINIVNSGGNSTELSEKKFDFFVHTLLSGLLLNFSHLISIALSLGHDLTRVGSRENLPQQDVL